MNFNHLLRLISFTLLLVFSGTLARTQTSSNMTLFSSVEVPDAPERFGAKYNDIWGYRHPNGTEIAIIGGTESIFFFNVTNPANPVLIHTHDVDNVVNGATNQSLWRDFKTYSHYAYAAADEGTSGLLIFDLSNVPNSVSLVLQTNAFWNKTHNIFIDEENGRLYAAGSNSVNSGLVVLDIATDPEDPELLANLPLTSYGGGYVHDVFVRDNIAYCSHGSLSKLQMYDLTDLAEPEVVGIVDNYPGEGYNHSSWLSDDGQFLVMCDETHGSEVKLIDIADPLNISSNDINVFDSELLGPNAPGSSVAHNPFVLGDLAFVSYYHDGVQVFNIADPENIELEAYYDTYPDNTGYSGYEGCWGVYPYLPSGIVIASDMTYGLFVMEVSNQSLDLEFLSFRAEQTEEHVRLDWHVWDAEGGRIFEIQRSVDGGATFEVIGETFLQDLRSNYVFTDPSVGPGKTYLYRIEFIQFDGRRITSPIRTVQTTTSGYGIRLMNPVQDELSIGLSYPFEFLDVELLDMTGKLCFTQRVFLPTATTNLTLPALSAGQYVVMLTWPGGREQVMVQKL